MLITTSSCMSYLTAVQRARAQPHTKHNQLHGRLTAQPPLAHNCAGAQRLVHFALRARSTAPRIHSKVRSCAFILYRIVCLQLCSIHSRQQISHLHHHLAAAGATLQPRYCIRHCTKALGAPRTASLHSGLNGRQRLGKLHHHLAAAGAALQPCHRIRHCSQPREAISTASFTASRPLRLAETQPAAPPPCRCWHHPAAVPPHQALTPAQ